MASFKPRLRPHLIVTEGEQDGAKTYTVKDDVTGESFRMYEVEYGIAQRLNGERTHAAIIEAVQHDLQLQIAPEDLARFVAALEERGLIEADPEVPGSNEQITTHVMASLLTPAPLEQDSTQAGNTPTAPTPVPPPILPPAPEAAPAPAPLLDESTTASPNDAVAAGAFALVTQELQLAHAPASDGEPYVPVNHDELQQMLREAIHRMVDDDVRGAASILHAAQALAPQDDRIGELARASESARASGTPAARQSLMARGATLYPELMPTPMPGTTTKQDAQPTPRAVRPVWLGLGVVALLGAVALGVVTQQGRATLAVEASRIKPGPHDVVVQGGQLLDPEVLATLSTKRPGKLVQVLAPGTAVAPKQVVATLQMPAPLQERLTRQQGRARQSETAYARLRGARDALVAQKRTVQQRLAALKSQSHPDLRQQAALTQSLRALERRERGVRAALVAAQNRRAQLALALRGAEAQAQPYLVRAAHAGLVGADARRTGQVVAAGDAIMTVVDGKTVRAAFTLWPQPELVVGAQVSVKAAPEAPARAAVVQYVAPGAEGRVQAVVAWPRPGTLPEAKALTLTAAHYPHAYRVPAGAYDSKHESLWILDEEARVQPLKMQCVENEAADVWVVPAAAPQNAHDLVVVTGAGPRALSALKAGQKTTWQPPAAIKH